jgi:hypothetical protein
MSTRSFVATTIAGVLSVLPATSALAQTCATPMAISANTAFVTTTCNGDTSLQLACGVIPLAGPATVVDVNLPYPSGSITIQSLDVNYQPTAFLLHADCDDSAPCSDAVDASIGGTIDLSTLDSGHYFLVVAASEPAPGANCGAVSITVNLTPEQEAGMLDGVFRSGSAPIWQP